MREGKRVPKTLRGLDYIDTADLIDAVYLSKENIYPRYVVEAICKNFVKQMKDCLFAVKPLHLRNILTLKPIRRPMRNTPLSKHKDGATRIHYKCYYAYALRMHLWRNTVEEVNDADESVTERAIYGAGNASQDRELPE